MFQPNRLIWLQKGKNYDDIMERALSGKDDPEAAVDKFHEEKDRVEKKRAFESEEDITKVSALMREQMDPSITIDKKFLNNNANDRLKKKLELQDPKARQEAIEEINLLQRNHRDYMAALSKGSNVKLVDGISVDVFTNDATKGINTKNQYIEEFIALTPTEQAKWLAEIEKDIEERTAQFRQLLELVDGKDERKEELAKFKTLRRSEREDHLKQIRNVTKEYKDMLERSGASPKAIKTRLAVFMEHGLEGKKLDIARLREALNVPDKDKEFKAASKERQEKHPDFYISTRAQKEKMLKEIRSEISAEYLDKAKSCPHPLSSADHELIESTVHGRFDISMAETCIKFFEKNYVKAAELVAEQSKQYKPEILDHFNWDAISTYERKQLIKKGGLVEKYAENSENVTLDQSYSKKLDGMVAHKPFGLLNERSAEKYMKWFRERSLKDKREIVNNAKGNPKLDYLQQTYDARLKLVSKFTKQLPKSIQKEYEDEFADSDFEDRMDLLLRIEKENTELNTEFEAKLEELVEEKLLCKKSQKRYLKWFTKDLNLQEKNDYLEDCNLDKPERRQILEIFEDKILEAAPVSEHNQMKERFYNADLNKRRDMVSKWLKQYIPGSKGLLRDKLNKLGDEKNLEAVSRIDSAYSPLLEKAEQYEADDDGERALMLYEDIFDSYEIPEPERKKIEARIKILRREQDQYRKLEEGHFTEVMDYEIDQILKNDGTLKEEQQMLTILEEIHDIQFRNEILFNRTMNTREQMDLTLEGDTYTQEFNEALFEYDDSASVYYDEHNELQLATNENVFDLNEWDNDEDIKYWKNYVSHRQEDPHEKRFDPTLSIMNPKTRQRLNANQFDKEMLFPARQAFIEKMFPKLLEAMDMDEDSLSPRALNAVTNHLYNRDWRVKLPKTNTRNPQAEE